MRNSNPCRCRAIFETRHLLPRSRRTRHCDQRQRGRGAPERGSSKTLQNHCQPIKVSRLIHDERHESHRSQLRGCSGSGCLQIAAHRPSYALEFSKQVRNPRASGGCAARLRLAAFDSERSKDRRRRSRLQARSLSFGHPRRPPPPKPPPLRLILGLEITVLNAPSRG